MAHRVARQTVAEAHVTAKEGWQWMRLADVLWGVEDQEGVRARP